MTKQEDEESCKSRVLRVVRLILKRHPRTLPEVRQARLAAVKQVASQDGVNQAPINQQLSTTLYKESQKKKADIARFDKHIHDAITQHTKQGSIGRGGIFSATAVKDDEQFQRDFRALFDERLTQVWPRKAPFDLGSQVSGNIMQASADAEIVLRRAASGGKAPAKTNDQPNGFKATHVRLFAQLHRAKIGVKSVHFVGRDAGKGAPLNVVLPQEAPENDVGKFVDDLFSELRRVKQKVTNKGGSSQSPFEATLTSKDWDQVCRALKGPGSTSVAPPSDLERWLSHAADVVLEGVPGTGKTHAVERLKNATLTTREKRTLSRVDIRFMTMHPSTSYEDFVEGLRPAGAWQNTVAAVKIESDSRGPWFCGPPSPVPSGSLPIEAADDAAGNQPADRSGVVARATFAIKNGFFVEACVAAVDDPKAAVVVVLDELNRCNIPKVLGDLLTVIEESKRVEWGQHGWHVEGAAQAVTLPYSGRRLFVPDNLFIVGTMNTTDRSVAPMDAALRRRFSFHRLFPQGFELTSPNKDELLSRLKQTAGVTHDDIMTRSHSLWSKVNQIFCDRYGADAMLGHSYLDDLARALKAAKNMDPVDPIVHYHWNHRILPQLMDTIASNGLMRALVSDPASFFADEPAKGGELAPVP